VLLTVTVKEVKHTHTICQGKLLNLTAGGTYNNQCTWRSKVSLAVLHTPRGSTLVNHIVTLG